MEFGEQNPEQTGKKAFERGLEIGAFTTRRLIDETTQKPSEREVRIALKSTSENLLPVIEKVITIDALKTFKELNSQYYNHPLSPPYLSASIIEVLAAELGKQAAIDFKKSNSLSSIPISSICNYDVCSGIMKVALTIIDAEKQIRGTIDSELGDFSSEYLAEIVPLQNQANFLLREKAKILKHSKLLKEDPTGKSLIRYAVEEIENPNNQSSPSLREFIVYGARFAETAYGIAYPLAERISKEEKYLPPKPLFQNLFRDWGRDVGTLTATF